MDPTRSGAVLARHAGIEEKTGQLCADADGGPRRLVISSDFYSVYSSAGRKASGLVNLYCWAHVRRHFVRAGDANPDQLSDWTAAWLERIKNLYAAHDELGQPCDVMSHVMSDHVDWRSVRGCDPVQCPWDRPRPGVRRG